MAETYCGKSCAECEQKEILACPGCKAGPGRQYGGDCELAACVRDKGHESCDTCGFKGNCGTLRHSHRVPEDRRRQMEREQLRQAAIAGRAPALGKWLWIAFWLVIPSTIGNLMANESMMKVFPGLYYPGEIISAVCTLVYGIILLRLGSEEDHYRASGICGLIAGGVSALVVLISGGAEPRTWTLLLSLPAAIVAMVGTFHEYMGHATVLTGVDSELSDEWVSLWKWHIGLFAAMLGSILLMLLAPILGAVALIVVAIGVFITGILKLVYLYRTAVIFRQMQQI